MTMHDPDDQTSDEPSSTPSDDAAVTPPPIEDIKTLLWDVQYQYHRANAVLLNLRELLMLTGQHEDDAALLDPTNLSFGLSDAISHLKTLSTLLDDIEGITYDADVSPPEATDHRRMRYRFRRLWSGLEREERHLILQAMKTMRGRPKFRGELAQFLQHLTARPQSRASKEGRDA
jgi:hypothetical protein